MKKIRNTNPNDRIICQKTIDAKLYFFFKPVDSKESLYLFDTANSPSVYSYFHDNGCRLGSDSFSLTIRQLYKFHDFHNKKLTHCLTKRIPALVDYIATERTWYKHSDPEYRNVRNIKHEYDELVA